MSPAETEPTWSEVVETLSIWLIPRFSRTKTGSSVLATSCYSSTISSGNLSHTTYSPHSVFFRTRNSGDKRKPTNQKILKTNLIPSFRKQGLLLREKIQTVSIKVFFPSWSISFCENKTPFKVYVNVDVMSCGLKINLITLIFSLIHHGRESSLSDDGFWILVDWHSENLRRLNGYLKDGGRLL